MGIPKTTRHAPKVNVEIVIIVDIVIVVIIVIKDVIVSIVGAWFIGWLLRGLGGGLN